MLKITLLVFAACFVFERLFAGWRLPKVHSWYTRVVLINIAQLGVVTAAGALWERWLAGTSLFHLPLSTWPGGFAAYFLATFVFYWWHRARHQSDLLWRLFHQIHHSPARLEVITSFYKHPQEMIVNSLIGSVLVYSILGLSLQAGAVYTLFTALGEFFYHTNVRTPRWIGYIFQRPEMHRIHHEYGKHKNNYGDFVIWDMLFGTYENPRDWNGRCGFDEELELRLGDMLKFRDVHKAVPAVQEGDLIFIGVPFFLFRRVAEATQSWTSHVGIVIRNARGELVVSESKVPFARETRVADYLARGEGRFEIRRLECALTDDERRRLREAARTNLRRRYGFGFDFDSRRLFCSKHVYETYRAIGIEVGELQTFEQLLAENPSGAMRFWRTWFFGSIPWSRRTVTPASQLRDSKFVTVA